MPSPGAGRNGCRRHDDLDRRPAGANAADDVAQHQRHLGPVRRLAGTQDDRDGLAGRRLVDVDWQKAAAMRVPQRELLAVVNPVLGVVDRSRRGTWSKLSQNNSTIAAIMRLSAVGPGRFSSRLMVGCEHRSWPLSGSRPTAILKAGSDLSASQSLPSG
jgi:hypothetical protein